MTDWFLSIAEQVLSWIHAVVQQAAFAIFDPSAATYLRDGFLAELIILIAAYWIGRFAQRSTDGRGARRVLGRDLVREFEELRRFQYREMNGRPEAREHGIDILKGTLKGITERIRTNAKITNAGDAFNEALTIYKDEWLHKKQITAGEQEVWRELSEKLKTMVKVLTGRRSPDLINRVERASVLKDARGEKSPNENGNSAQET